MTDDTQIKNNWLRVKSEIQAVWQAHQNGSSGNPEPTLLAVSKRHPVEAIAHLHKQGQVSFGENHINEAVEKIAQLPPTIEWHYIGGIQSNKTKAIAENFSWVQSLDRLKIAERLSNQRPVGLPNLQVLIQVNIDNEPQKSGITLADVAELARAIDALPNMDCRGMMCIPQNTSDAVQQVQAFSSMRRIWASLRSQFDRFDTLSMGMSSDYVRAIENGSTMVRIGSTIFGKRM